MSCHIWQVDPAHFTPYYDAALCAALARAGCSVRLLTSCYLYDPALPCSTAYETDHIYFRWLNHRALLRVPRLRRWFRGVSYWRGHRRVLEQMHRQPPDLIHFQWCCLPVMDRWLLDQTHRLGIPVVYTAHDVESLFPYTPAAGQESIYARVDRIVVHAEANRQTLLNRAPAERVRVVPHIATGIWQPPDASREHARQQLGIPAKAAVALFFGSVRPYKGIEDLVEAFRLARQARPDLWLLVAGNVIRRADAALLKRADPQVIVHPHYIPHTQAWRYHATADVAVFPYRQISQSGALITAMRFGLPVIVTDVGGLPETVDRNGWVIPARDPYTLAQTLLTAFSDLPRLRSMGGRSAALIRERHDPASIAGQMIALYQELLK